MELTKRAPLDTAIRQVEGMSKTLWAFAASLLVTDRVAAGANRVIENGFDQSLEDEG